MHDRGHPSARLFSGIGRGLGSRLGDFVRVMLTGSSDVSVRVRFYFFSLAEDPQGRMTVGNAMPSGEVVGC